MDTVILHYIKVVFLFVQTIDMFEGNGDNEFISDFLIFTQNSVLFIT